MREQEERTRHFVAKRKNEDSFDEPAVKRRRFIADDDEDVSSARTGFFARYGAGRKDADEHEEEERRPKKSKISREMDEFDDYDDEEERRKAPALVRIFAWIALLAIFFACGYLGANYFFNWADKKGGSRIGSVIGSPTEVSAVAPSGAQTSVENSDGAYTLYMPDNGKFTTREINIRKGLPEEDIDKVIGMYVDGLKESQMLETGVKTLNLYRSGDWLYLDMNGAFQSSLKTLGEEKSSFIITGLVKTIKENFPPIKKIKFYIDGGESSQKKPVDLTKPWELTK